jgi:hypothetical protein
MNAVGECVSRPVFGRSMPRGASAPPQTRTAGSAALIASYESASSDRYAGAATSSPFGPNCGSQNRFRFGSLPMITSSTSGSARTSAAAYEAKSVWSLEVNGVVREPAAYTWT